MPLCNVGGDVTNATTIDNSVVIIKEGDTYTYNGGDKVINNYQQGEVVRLTGDFQGVGVNGNSFLVNSSTGSLEIQESRDKFISYAYGNSDVIATSYLASGGGDEFVYKVGSGNDVIQNANGADVVNLDGVTLDQIADVSINVGEVNAKFADGGSLKIQGDSNVGYKLGDAVYKVNQSTGEWSAK